MEPAIFFAYFHSINDQICHFVFYIMREAVLVIFESDRTTSLLEFSVGHNLSKS